MITSATILTATILTATILTATIPAAKILEKNYQKTPWHVNRLLALSERGTEDRLIAEKIPSSAQKLLLGI